MKNEKQIRLEALQLAHNDEILKFIEKITFLKENFAATDEESFARYEDFLNQDILDSLFPTTTNITNRAEEYYKFLNKD